MKSWLWSIPLFALIIPVSALAQPPLTSFNTGIGVTPFVNSGTADSPTLAANVVRGVNPAGNPWRVGSLVVTVDIDGNIQVYVTRLVLAGGNSLGANPVPSVQVKLFCGGSDTAFNTPVIAMGPNDNFAFFGLLSAVPPAPCTSPALLIVAAPNGAWLAAGIPDNNRQ